MTTNRIVHEDIMEIITSGCVDWKRFHDKTVLITGASGMLPSYMALTLLTLNHIMNLDITVIALVRNRQKAEKIFQDFTLDRQLQLLIQDVSQPFNYQEKIDFIIHAASQASPKFYGTDPVGTLNANIIGTHNLLEYAKNNPVEGFLFFSTGGIYGNLSKDDTRISESTYGIIDPLNIRSCYFESKRMAENMCVCYAYQYGVPAKIIRIFHTLGPNIDMNDGRAFSDFCKSVVTGKNIVLKSDGNAKRTFLYVTDAVNGYFKVLLDGEIGQAYNVGASSQEISMKELAELLVSLYPEKKLSVEYQINPESVTYTKMRNPVNRILPDITRLQSLGWEEKKDITSVFTRTISALSNN